MAKIHPPPTLGTEAQTMAEGVNGADSTFQRLTTLLRLAEGAWALAVFEDGAVQRRITAELRTTLSPLPVLERSLVDRGPDPLSILNEITGTDIEAAPVVVFTGVGSALPDLSGYLDTQREALARLPHRLLFWVSDYEKGRLAEESPNFYSRLSGVFRFPGRGDGAVVTRDGRETAHLPESMATAGRRRPSLPASSENERERLIEFQRDRIHDLRTLPRPDFRAIGGAWYDLAGLYEEALPRRWAEAEAAYLEAARAYAAGYAHWQADALYQAGDAAMRAYAPAAALEHLDQAVTLFRLHENHEGEANVLKAKGDVLAFLDRRDEALTHYDNAFRLFQQVGSSLGQANVL
ncbi:MAG: hypothetical protein K1X65_03480, partial [Caldilineales bacterium]|nr:hypothetical protein [Caldilineales bacterium]